MKGRNLGNKHLEWYHFYASFQDCRRCMNSLCFDHSPNKNGIGFDHCYTCSYLFPWRCTVAKNSQDPFDIVDLDYFSTNSLNLFWQISNHTKPGNTKKSHVMQGWRKWHDLALCGVSVKWWSGAFGGFHQLEIGHDTRSLFAMAQHCHELVVTQKSRKYPWRQTTRGGIYLHEACFASGK